MYKFSKFLKYFKFLSKNLTKI